MNLLLPAEEEELLSDETRLIASDDSCKIHIVISAK